MTKPFIEYGTGWAKVHFRREMTDEDRAKLEVAIRDTDEVVDDVARAIVAETNRIMGPTGSHSEFGPDGRALARAAIRALVTRS